MSDSPGDHAEPTPVVAPRANEFPAAAQAWHYFGLSREIDSARPLGRDLLGQRLVAFRNSAGEVKVLQARCSHLGSDLSRGCIRDGLLECEYHQWRYAGDGSCAHIPITRDIPDWARQRTYPVVERHGMVYVFNGDKPNFQLPFFPDCDPTDFTPSRPFYAELNCPWYLIGANAFDIQHYRAAHSRMLVSEPVVESPAPFARRISATFDVSGQTIMDRLTRLLSGPRLTMTITDWCGSLIFVTARFRRTCSYGHVAVEPLPGGRVRVRTQIFVPRSRTLLGRLAIDPLHGEIRRFFIKEFMREDARRLNGVPYQPAGLIAEDRALTEYFAWLAAAAQGNPPEPRLQRNVSPVAAHNH